MISLVWRSPRRNLPLDRASRHLRNELPLEEHEHNEGWNHDDDHIREEQVPLSAELAYKAVQRKRCDELLRRAAKDHVCLRVCLRKLGMQRPRLYMPRWSL
jgi:hypothetical protein